MHKSDAVDPLELAAYVDDQLDASSRIAVEHALSHNPAAAAEVMADLRVRDELRLALAGAETNSLPQTSDLARRLQGRLNRGRFFRKVRPLMVASLLLAAGWLANGQLGQFSTLQASSDVPVFVADAIAANRTSSLRARMISQIEAPDYDADELLAETAIRMPSLSADWSVTDVQVFPSRFGPSVEMAVDAGTLGAISIFAVRPGEFVSAEPVTVEVEDTVTAYWQFGDIAYALVAQAEPRAVSAAANTLLDTLY